MRLNVSVVLVALAPIAACATNPAAGRREGLVPTGAPPQAGPLIKVVLAG